MISSINLLSEKESISYDEYIKVYGTKIMPDSEKIFLSEFLFPILGSNEMVNVIPQYPFIDSEGHSRKIDFAFIKNDIKIAFEVNGEIYHAEGIIPSDQFDDNLFRQNEILRHGWILLRFSYNQLLSPNWRNRVISSIKSTLKSNIPYILSSEKITPNPIQIEVLRQLDYYRAQNWKKGLVIMPTGTGKTYLSALDSFKTSKKRVLFIVHRLDILDQAKESFSEIWKDSQMGLLTGEEQTHIHDSRVLFASKDTLCKMEVLEEFNRSEFDYIIVDEVHHGQCPTYKIIFDYFNPDFLLGMTATPDRTDRKDIMELFDYKKICEYDTNDAIERGFLVAYSYYGLQDDIDYSKIKYNGRHYNVIDLEKSLIIEKRNEAIYNKYLELCNGDKAIGFCVSIKHAERMAEYFNTRGVKSIAITSNSDIDRTTALKDFRNNEYAVAFTVDIFNEGIDVPNVQALLLLRPTESKTVFIQQLGRGLRISPNKNKLTILDFIGNYKRANKIREYLSTGRQEITKPDTMAFERYEYNYNPRCDVHFDESVQEILERQDIDQHEITKEDLIDAYYSVKEKIEKKPTQDEINEYGVYKSSKYVAMFGGWISFLQNIGEATESSYHYPQGVHLGHIFYILKILYDKKQKNSRIDTSYIRLRGNMSEGKLGSYQRQTKYKIQAMMEMGLIVDDRKSPIPLDNISLSYVGQELCQNFYELIDTMDFSFKEKGLDALSWEMCVSTEKFNEQIWSFIKNDENKKQLMRKILLKIDAVKQMLEYLYCDARCVTIQKNSVYLNFFKSPAVLKYCEQNGIEPSTDEAAKHRIPFLFNLLEATGIISQSYSEINVKILLLTDYLIYMPKDTIELVEKRKLNIIKHPDKLSNIEIEYLKERFGNEFMTSQYPINIIEIM